MQNWTRLYSYIEEYQNLLYDVYSKHAVAYLTTFWHIDSTATVWDDVEIMGGSYEKLGDLSGMKWNKILLLPVYYIEEMTNIWDGTETGLIMEGESSIVIPSSYGFVPYHNDIVKFETSFLYNNPDIYPIFAVTGIEKSTRGDHTFYKLRVKVEQSKTTSEVDDQTTNIYTFFDYDKKIHTVDDAEFLTRMLSKNEDLRENLKGLFDQNSGFYLI